MSKSFRVSVIILLSIICVSCQKYNDNRKKADNENSISSDLAVKDEGNLTPAISLNNQTLNDEIIKDNIDTNTIMESEYSETSYYLIDMKPLLITNIYGSIKWRTTYTNTPIIIDGVKYGNGFAMHPPSEGFGQISYAINKEYTTFKTGIAVTDKGSVIFSIIGDTNTLFTSDVITKESGMQSVEVEISEVTILILRVDKGQDNWCDHAVWVDPVLIRR